MPDFGISFLDQDQNGLRKKLFPGGAQGGGPNQIVGLQLPRFLGAGNISPLTAARAPALPPGLAGSTSPVGRPMSGLAQAISQSVMDEVLGGGGAGASIMSPMGMPPSVPGPGPLPPRPPVVRPGQEAGEEGEEAPPQTQPPPSPIDPEIMQLLQSLNLGPINPLGGMSLDLSSILPAFVGAFPRP